MKQLEKILSEMERKAYRDSLEDEEDLYKS
jgi:hypothetical protein